MKAPVDLLANVERSEADRPSPVAPLVPDWQPPKRPWLGSAGSEVAYWRERARRAERRMGELLAEMPKAEGELLRGTHREPRETSGNVPTLAEQGISKKESATWQAERAQAELRFHEREPERFERMLEATCAAMRGGP